ncbi:hypothetical protein [Brevibacterium picturae]|uniref:hypothetical protein n=1 Tax=Brevibacterium picturae TaxID=260553 RepID=UPI0031F91611
MFIELSRFTGACRFRGFGMFCRFRRMLCIGESEFAWRRRSYFIEAICQWMTIQVEAGLAQELSVGRRIFAFAAVSLTCRDSGRGRFVTPVLLDALAVGGEGHGLGIRSSTALLSA